MWIFLWVVLSSILIGATLWSLQILMRQKAAWQTFAKSKNLTFTRGTFMGPAEVGGVIGDYKIGIFAAERGGSDIRVRRYVSVLEISLIDGLVDGGVMGDKEMLAFMQSLDLLHPYKVEMPGWEEGHFAFVRNDEVMKAYLTPERLEVFSNLLKTRNADGLIVFNDRELVVRLETSDPMQDADKIDKAVKRVIALCEKLRITPQQREDYMAWVKPAQT